MLNYYLNEFFSYLFPLWKTSELCRISLDEFVFIYKIYKPASEKSLQCEFDLNFHLYINRDLVSVLQDHEVPIYLVSGGFDVMIEPVAEELSIPFDNIFANKLKFYFNGKVFSICKFCFQCL